MELDLLVQRLHIPDILLRHLFDRHADLRAQIPRRVHHPIRALAQHHPPAPIVQLILELNGRTARVVLRVQVRDHALLISRQLHDQVEEAGAPPLIGKVHLEVVRVDVEKEDAVVALVGGHGLDHGGGEEPVVDLTTGRSLRVPLLFETPERETGVLLWIRGS